MRNKAERRGRREILAILFLGLIAFSGPTGLMAQEVQVGRYATLRPVPTPEQTALLTAQATVRFPGSVITVGQAVASLLQPRGYRLAAEAAADPSRAALLALPLPEPHRALGPMPLRTALETLAGPAFRLVEDPEHRLVTFERCGAVGARRSVKSSSTRR